MMFLSRTVEMMRRILAMDGEKIRIYEILKNVKLGMEGILEMESEMVILEMVDTQEMVIYAILEIARLIGTEEQIPEKMVGINRNVAKNVTLIGIVKIIGIITEIVRIKLIGTLGILSLKTRIRETQIPNLGILEPQIHATQAPLHELQKSLGTRIPETTIHETRNLTRDRETHHPTRLHLTDNQPISRTLAHLPLSKTNTFVGKTAKPWLKNRRLNF